MIEFAANRKNDFNPAELIFAQMPLQCYYGEQPEHFISQKRIFIKEIKRFINL
jgi:hypothetical protein